MIPRDPLVLALCGRAGTGKTTAAAYLVERYGFEPIAFADPIRAMLECLLIEQRIDYAWLHEPSLKERAIPPLGTSARHLMQSLGDWGRALDPDWWVSALAAAAGLAGSPDTWAPVHDRILITDLRFANEAAWLDGLCATTIKITRADAPVVREHRSEDHIDAIAATNTIANDGPTLEGLHAALDSVMREHGIEPRPGRNEGQL
jgi:hypothetical protein